MSEARPFPTSGRTAWAAAIALVIATIQIVSTALVALRTSNAVTEAEASVIDSQSIRLELAGLLDKHAGIEASDLDERLARVDRLAGSDPEHRRDLAHIRDLERAGASFAEIRTMVERMNAREEALISAREAELRASRRVDQLTTLASLISGLAFVASVAVLLARRSRADRLAAEALRASEERLRLFIEHAPAALAMFDREMRYLGASRRWCEDYGLDATAIEGRAHDDLVREVDVWRAGRERALAGEVKRSDLDRVVERGRERWLRWELRPWFASPKTIGGVIAIVEDVTERRRAEEARDRAVEHARHADRLATVGRLAAGVAHEVGTPLSVATGHAEMIVTGEVGGEQTLKSGRVIVTQIERVTKIVRQLLDFSRRRAPREATSTETVDVGAVAGHTIELLRSTGAQRGIRLEMIVESPRIRAFGSEEAIAQVVTNLVMNAIHASHDGDAITVSVGEATSSAGEPVVRLEVRDVGTGMTDDVREHVFDPFFTTKGIGDGTGLGLSVVHGIVQDHRGSIEVDTKVGLGTTFTVLLPLANATA